MESSYKVKMMVDIFWVFTLYRCVRAALGRFMTSVFCCPSAAGAGLAHMVAPSVCVTHGGVALPVCADIWMCH